MAYRMEGTGPALLLLHGIAGSSRTWRDVIPRLTDRFTVIAPDLMGHGLSEKPVGDYSLGAFASGIRDLLEVLDIDRTSVVGQSFGGGVAMQLAYQHPELCDRLVLVDSGGLGREVNWMLRFMTLPGSEYLMPLIFPGFVRDWGDSLLRSVNDRGFRLNRITEMWSAYASLAEAENRQAFARTIRSVIDPGGQSVSALDRLYLAASVPTLIIWGDRDDIIPLSLLASTNGLALRDRVCERITLAVGAHESIPITPMTRKTLDGKIDAITMSNGSNGNTRTTSVFLMSTSPDFPP